DGRVDPHLCHRVHFPRGIRLRRRVARRHGLRHLHAGFPLWGAGADRIPQSLLHLSYFRRDIRLPVCRVRHLLQSPSSLKRRYSMFDMFMTAFSSACSLEALVANFIGVALGIVFGALPGLTAVMGVALLIPLTFGFPAV